MKVSVISSTVPYYPIDAKKQSEIQPMYHIISFIKRTVDTGLDYIIGNDRTIAFQFINNVLFLICDKSKSPEFLFYQIEILKNIAILILGPNFQTSMQTTIDVQQNKLYVRYVDTYIDFSSRLCQIPFGIIEYSPLYNTFTKTFLENFPIESHPSKSNFVQLLILNDHQILTRISNNCTIEYTSILMLFFTAYVNHKDPDSYSNEHDISIGPNSIIHRKCYLKVNGTVSQYVVSTVRFSELSPYVAIIVSNNFEMRDIDYYIDMFARTASAGFCITTPLSIHLVPGTVRYVIINRTNGESWDHKLQSMDKQNSELTDILFSSMKSKVFDILMKGYNCFMWYDNNFLFVYEQIFMLSTGELLSVKRSKEFMAEKIRFNYQCVAQRIFPTQKNVNVFESYAIFIKTISPKDALEITKKYFSDFLASRQVKQIQNKKRSASNFFKKRSQSFTNLDLEKNSKLAHTASNHNLGRQNPKHPLPPKK
ncbi:hypothetical protein GPJ56_010919 [Histomonas meleagridis]|uniref:uncharacterized protein n=1 Tax=Histomonas meleagridis TaxID=135588 RepID=UPI00355AB94C|nr:hypothetical protein GPJ56_010919 [Histomonas meleagridis]KAH0806280.1 hypothetical protein GO595_000968 [Histomonas meleagridis]